MLGAREAMPVALELYPVEGPAHRFQAWIAGAYEKVEDPKERRVSHDRYCRSRRLCRLRGGIAAGRNDDRHRTTN